METARHSENQPQKGDFSKDAPDISPVTPAEAPTEAFKQSARGETSGLDFEKILSSDAFGAFVKEKGVDQVMSLNKAFQKSLDQEGPSRETPDWAKAMQEKIEALETGRKAESSRAQAQALLSKTTLPDPLKEKWIGRIRFEGDRPVEEQVKALEEEYAEIERSLLTKNSALGLPIGGQTHAIGEKEVENIVANL